MMNYEEALYYIHNTNRFGSKLGLENMRHLLELMGNPQDKLRFVHIAGTNGKGSVAAFISSILMKAGYRTGLYTSPYIERFTERIRINSEEISWDNLARITSLVKEKIDIMTAGGMNHPTEFEVVTAVAFQYYLEQQCDVIVLEVGLGGRLDATNIIRTPLVSVITAIALDHTDILGDTIEKIAREKAGIIKQGGNVVIYPQDEKIAAIFRDVAQSSNCSITAVNDTMIKPGPFDEDGQYFSYGEYKNLRIRLIGQHQLSNAAVAIEAISALRHSGLKVSDQNISDGLKSAVWAGRMEILRKDPLLIIDGAHNAQGADALAETLRAYFPEKKKIFIIGVLKDKDYGQLIKAVSDMASHFLTVTPDSQRALNGEVLADFIREYYNNIGNDTIDVEYCTSIRDAVIKGLGLAGKDDLVCAFGSLYYIGEVRHLALNENI